MFVLVAGPPGSGKSTLASPLASELSLPLLVKDAIKDALIEVDTTDNVDVAAVAARVRSAVAEAA